METVAVDLRSFAAGFIRNSELGRRFLQFHMTFLLNYLWYLSEKKEEKRHNI